MTVYSAFISTSTVPPYSIDQYGMTSILQAEDISKTTMFVAGGPSKTSMLVAGNPRKTSMFEAGEPSKTSMLVAGATNIRPGQFDKPCWSMLIFFPAGLLHVIH